MTWRTPPFDRAIAELEAYVRATYDPLGVIVSGSIVRGNPDPTSDFDVVVVHDQPWRLREQRRFADVPAELFVNPPAQIRRYFEREHAAGKPCTAHMLATGERLGASHPVLDELVHEAADWLARPLAPEPAQLTAQRYGAVDLLDDARDVIARDPATAALLLARAVDAIVEHAFWQRERFQPRRKDTLTALASIDPEAASLARRWASSTGRDALDAAEALARHVIGETTFFTWTSAREPVPA